MFNSTYLHVYLLKMKANTLGLSLTADSIYNPRFFCKPIFFGIISKLILDYIQIVAHFYPAKILSR